MYVREYVDPASWNVLVKEHPRNHLLQSWGWGELKGAFGWEPLRLAVINGAHVAAAQVLFRRMAGLAVAYVPRGPLWSGDPEVDRALLHALRRVARHRRSAFLRLEPNVSESDPAVAAVHAALLVAGFKAAPPLQPRTTIQLDLLPPLDKLFAGASKGHRADVRRAERLGVTIRTGATPSDFEAFYSIMQATGARAHFGIHSAEYYRRAFDEMSAATYCGDEGGAARLLLAEYQGAPVAAFMIFAWGDEGQYMYSGADAAGLRCGANHLLQWHAIQWVRAQGCRRYDLWGVPEIVGRLETAPPEERAALETAAQADPLYGAYRFKKGWGGGLVRYVPAYDQVYLAPAYWWWKRRRASA